MTVDTTKSDATTPDEPYHVGEQADLDRLVEDNQVVLADFYADWCGPCKMLEPVAEKIAVETDAAVAKIDVDVNQPLAMTYGVRGVPTMVLFVGGDRVQDLVGFHDEDQLRQLVQQYTS